MLDASKKGALSTIFLGAIGAIIALIIVGNVPGLATKITPLLQSEKTIQITQPINAEGEPTATGEYESLVVAAVEASNPAVVAIVITKDVPVIERYFDQGPSSPFDFFNDDFFNFGTPRYRENGTEKREVGGGSGFLVSDDGLIMTNRHVVSEENAEYTVFTNSGDKYEAKIIARDPFHDLAIMKIEGNNFPYLAFGNSDNLRAGQSVIAIGNALAEFRNTVSVGVVSGLSRSIIAGDNAGGSELLEGVIQTDAAINPGNSGGPLLNLQGFVIGVNVAVAGGSENIAFAIPGNIARSALASVQKDGRISRPYLGVRYVPVTETMKETNNLTVDYGALIVRGESVDELAIIPGSPADKAGILENDIILEINGTKVDANNSLAKLVRTHTIGESINLKILSKGEEKELTILLEEAPQ